MNGNPRQTLAPACHHCGQPMKFQAVQDAGDKRMDVIQCSHCHVEAVEERSAA